MHPCRVVALVLVVGTLSGCLGSESSGRKWIANWRPFQGVQGPDVVQMDVALLEVPVGDRYVNDELWGLADEQVVSLETKARLEDNGLRVGQVSAAPPAGLHELLTSGRSSPNPRRVQLHSGKPSPPQLLGPAREHLHFELRLGGPSETVELKQALAGLVVVPTLTEDGRTRLRFTPQVRHAAEGGLPWKPRADLAAWTLQSGHAEETYAGLRWEVTLAPGEYVVIGARFDRPGTLGHETFVRADEPVPVQRLLVIRTARPAPSVSAATHGKAPPLALQANWSSVRGACP
jgi:hypothetical protein